MPLIRVGPDFGGTQAEWSAPATVNAQSQIFFGENPATSVSNNGSFVSFTTPPGVPGPVDVVAFATDGGMQFIPDGFSYGPSILQVTPDTATADGGSIGVIYGYGFGPVTANPTIPSDLKLTVGGKAAPIVAFNPNAYNLLLQPFLLEAIYYTVPSGLVGPADVTVTTGSGSATTPGALTYLVAPKQYPLPSAALVQGVYDPIHDLYYFTDANKIQVFSMTQGAWLTPISIPAPAGQAQRLWGISLSPDGSKLAVTDAQAGVIYLLDPSNPSSVKTFQPVPQSLPSGIIFTPAGIAMDNSGMAYFAADVVGGTGFHNFFKLDTNTGALTDYGVDGPGLGAQDLYLKTALSLDGTRVYFNDDGYIFNVDTATGKLFSASTDPGCCYGNYDLALSSNQTQFEATSYLYDSDLNDQSSLSMNDREIQGVSYVYGAKLSPDGSLLFQPSASGVDIFDGRAGPLRNRLTLPFALSTNYDALVADGKDNVLIAITGTNGNGIAVVDLTMISEPPLLLYANSTISAAQNTPVNRGLSVGQDLEPVQRTNLSRSLLATRRLVIPHATNPNVLPHR